MVKPFSKSKRTTVRLRHRIEKASAAKQRKQRKEAKKNPQWKSRLKKDPGIPNLFPLKDKILAEVANRKRERLEQTSQAQKIVRDDDETEEVPQEELDDTPMLDDDELLEGSDDTDEDPMAALLASAQARANEYQGQQDHRDTDEEELEDGGATSVSQKHSINYQNSDMSRRAFDKVFKQVLEAADVILYVLDARDPDGTRSPEVERQVMAAASESKRLILVLNKIDLVPASVLKDWLTYLRRYCPTIPLRASTPASNANTFDHKNLTVKGTSETLLRALKSYAALRHARRSISVGVIGYPNVGKSSVINALTSRLNKGRQRTACAVGAEAGVTTNIQEVKVDNKLKIMDSPGIVFPSVTTSDNKNGSKVQNAARLTLLNALPPKQISDPVPAVTLLLQRLSASPNLYDQLLQYYGVTALGPFRDGDPTDDFLIQVARSRGRIGKGGLPNLNAAAMTVINDFRDGRVQGWAEPPSQIPTDGAGTNGHDGDVVMGGPALDRKEIVKEWAAEFKLKGLWGDGSMEEVS